MKAAVEIWQLYPVYFAIVMCLRRMGKLMACVQLMAWLEPA